MMDVVVPVDVVVGGGGVVKRKKVGVEEESAERGEHGSRGLNAVPSYGCLIPGHSSFAP